MSSLQGPVRFGKPHSELTEEELNLLNQENNVRIVEIFKEIFNEQIGNT